MSPPRIQRDDIGICRYGPVSDIDKEKRVEQWPDALQQWIPIVHKCEQRENIIFRWEENLGGLHPKPMESIQQWWDIRVPFWTPEEEQQNTLRYWLKQVEPAYKVDAKTLWKILREHRGELPFVPSKKELLRALDSTVSITLHRGYVHGKLNERRVREKGFICWRGAKTQGLRGADVAAFFLPHQQPKDVLLHILKWSWKNDPLRAFDALLELGVIKEKAIRAEISASAHPSLSKKNIETIIGCPLGMVSAKQAGVALARTKSMIIGGSPVHIQCTPSVPKREDKDFFLPRNRTSESLFSLWSKGIQLDEEGRYSLTPEKMACIIAKKTPRSIVWDAFCGCGGNAIAFARQAHISKVIATDTNASRLAMAKHNAKLYGVAHKIDFRCADVHDLDIDDVFVFADPPWGAGEEYLHRTRSWFMERYPRGMIKLPVAFPLPDDAQISLFCTQEGYPSFVVQHWG